MSGRDHDGSGPPSREDRLAVIEQLRIRIDDLDERLVELLNERAMCAVEIGHQKRALGLKVYQPGRERHVLAHVHRVCRGPLPGEAVTRVFERIIDEARRLERLGTEDEEADS
jgi:chorismate mutase